MQFGFNNVTKVVSVSNADISKVLSFIIRLLKFQTEVVQSLFKGTLFDKLDSLSLALCVCVCVCVCVYS